MKNRLIAPILALLENHPEGIDEYSILKALESNPVLRDISGQGQLPLFYKHFIIMNALYQLQDKLWQEQRRFLEITPLINRLASNAAPESEGQSLMQQSKGPRDYYLNWDNFHTTTEDDVANLYKQFWEYMIRDEKREDALNTLGLPMDAAKDAITERYRHLAMQHHPDKGGNAEHFVKIKAAYEVLRER